MNKVAWKRFIPLILIIVIMILVYATGLTDLITFEQLKDNRQTLLDYVNNHPILSAIGFMLLYAASTALSIPGGVFLTIFGGFLFPQPLSTIFVVIGATIGAIIIFLVAKTALGDIMREKAGPVIQKMQKGFQENATSYLLFLRLVPLFPFWLVNIAPAFFGVSLLTFSWTTFVGIIPGAFVYTQAGAGLGSILDTQKEFSLEGIFTWDVKIALIALGIFSLLPIVIKKLRTKPLK